MKKKLTCLKTSLVLRNPKVEIEDKKIVVGVLNKIRYTLLDYYLDHNSIVKLHQQYQLDDTNSVLNKYLKDGNSVAEIMYQNETLRNGKKSLLEFTNFELKIYTIF